MPSKRRVILSGTPIQNDLQEFYYIMDVVNPGVMGNLAAFKRVYEKPILQSKERNCKESQKEEGDARAKELTRKCNMFILRRTAQILIPYLPPKVEQILFCRLSDVQVKLYSYFLKSRNFQTEIMESMSFAFGCIALMSKLCNHPSLIYEKCKNEFPDAIALFGSTFDPNQCQTEFSGKIEAVDRILKVVKEEKQNNKVILVSNYTKTLDVLEKFCRNRKFLFLRLDGSTDSAKRMKLVERFNDKFSPEFIFLLSSKAGGVGLNLIGGNRLILLDPDWNPATDEQAMARIWREGQSKPVFIYRMFSTGTIEEKIYQRQMRKVALSRTIVDESLSEKRNFTSDELKRLFELNIHTLSDTHDLIACTCLGNTKKNYGRNKFSSSSHQKVKENLGGITFSADDGWNHYDNLSSCEDPAISQMDNSFESDIYSDDLKNLISCIFVHKTKDISDIPDVENHEQEEIEKVQYFGYEEDDFVSKKTKQPKKKQTTKHIKKEIKKEIKEEIVEEDEDPSSDEASEEISTLQDLEEEEEDDTVEQTISDEEDINVTLDKSKKLTKLDSSNLLDEKDDEMLELLEFSSDSEE